LFTKDLEPNILDKDEDKLSGSEVFHAKKKKKHFCLFCIMQIGVLKPVREHSIFSLD